MTGFGASLLFGAGMDFEWMYGDAATGKFGFNELAALNPLRWSGPKSFSDVDVEIQEILKSGSRPIIVKVPAGVHGNSTHFAQNQQAVEYLILSREKDRARRETLKGARLRKEIARKSTMRLEQSANAAVAAEEQENHVAAAMLNAGKADDAVKAAETVKPAEMLKAGKTDTGYFDAETEAGESHSDLVDAETEAGEVDIGIPSVSASMLNAGEADDAVEAAETVKAAEMLKAGKTDSFFSDATTEAEWDSTGESHIDLDDAETEAGEVDIGSR